MTNTIKVKFAKMSSQAVAPRRAKADDAGYDLYNMEHVVLLPGERKVVDTGICVEIPKGWCVQLLERSGYAWECGLQVLGGLIDSGYRNSIKVILYNSGSSVFSVPEHSRITQMKFSEVPDAEFEEVDISDLSPSERGLGGLGSTGK